MVILPPTPTLRPFYKALAFYSSQNEVVAGEWKTPSVLPVSSSPFVSSPALAAASTLSCLSHLFSSEVTECDWCPAYAHPSWEAAVLRDPLPLCCSRRSIPDAAHSLRDGESTTGKEFWDRQSFVSACFLLGFSVGDVSGESGGGCGQQEKVDCVSAEPGAAGWSIDAP